MLTALGITITAITGLLTLLLVEVRKAKAEAAHAAAETAAILARVTAAQDATLTQVANDHTSNLRADLDELRAVSRESLTLAKQTHTSVMILGSELRHERERVDRFDGEAHATHKDIYDRLRELEKDRNKWTRNTD